MSSVSRGSRDLSPDLDPDARTAGPSRGPRDLPGEIRRALDDADLQAALQKALPRVDAKRVRALRRLDDYEGARDRARAVKERAIAELPALIRRLEASVRAAGGEVHHAADGDEACRIVVGIASRHGARRAVKSKSMTSEEIRLNAALEAADVAVRETDLGEYIVQLSGDRPSHIIAPIIHKTLEDVRRAFRDGLDLDVVPRRAEGLTQLARQRLRQDFLEADLGITGANFLLADTGTVVIVENEGNARLTTQLPPVHVVLAGVDKVIPGVGELLPFLQLLPRSATGQLQTSYLSFVSPPGAAGAPPGSGVASEERRATGEPSPARRRGPRQAFHLVLLDNGRMAMRDDPVLREALYCIRCGACLNVCPPYRAVGGHVYGGLTYQSGIGNAWEAGVHGLDAAAGFNQLCTTCTRCQDVCPVRIDIPWMNAVLRGRIAADGRRGAGLVERLFARPERLYRWSRRTGALGRWLSRSRRLREWMEALLGLDRRRPLPLASGPSLRQWHRRRGGSVVGSPDAAARLAGELSPRRDVVLWVDCHSDHVEQDSGRAAVAVLESLGYRVHAVGGACCGRGALSQGMIDTARDQAHEVQGLLQPLAAAGLSVVGLEPSCLSAVHGDHRRLLCEGAAGSFPGEGAASLSLGDGAAESTSGAIGGNPVSRVSGACEDFATFLLRHADRLAAAAAAAQPEGAWHVVVHGHCQQKTAGWAADVAELFSALPRTEVAVTAAECCGMAGSFGYKADFYDLSVELGRRLADEVGELQAAAASSLTVVAAGTSCRAQLRDVADVEALHPAEALARRLGL